MVVNYVDLLKVCLSIFSVNRVIRLNLQPGTRYVYSYQRKVNKIVITKT